MPLNALNSSPLSGPNLLSNSLAIDHAHDPNHKNWGRQPRVFPQIKAIISPQPKPSSLLALKDMLPRHTSLSDIVVVDLRAEFHGFNLEEDVSYHQACKQNFHPITHPEKYFQALSHASQPKDTGKRFNTYVEKLLSAEKEWAKKNELTTEQTWIETLNQTHGLKIGYRRIPIIDHKHPCPEAIETYLATLASPANLLLHCRAGESRSGGAGIVRTKLLGQVPP